MKRLVALVAVVAAMMALTVAPAFASSDDDFEVCWNGDTISGLSYHDANYLVDHTSATWGSCNNNNGGGFNNYWPRGAQRAF